MPSGSLWSAHLADDCSAQVRSQPHQRMFWSVHSMSSLHHAFSSCQYLSLYLSLSMFSSGFHFSAGVRFCGVPSSAPDSEPWSWSPCAPTYTRLGTASFLHNRDLQRPTMSRSFSSMDKRSLIHAKLSFFLLSLSLPKMRFWIGMSTQASSSLDSLAIDKVIRSTKD